MSEPKHRWISPEEYLALEEQAELKSEYFDGEIFAMAGSSPEHNLITVNISADLTRQLEERPCRVYSMDLRIQVSKTGLYTYPDVSVVCSAAEFEETRPRTLLNPTLIVEVLSDSTEVYDRRDKFDHYQTLPSLREYVLVSSNKRRIERFARSENGADWVLTTCTDPVGVLQLPSIGCQLELCRVYHKVEFPPVEPGTRRGPGSEGQLHLS